MLSNYLLSVTDWLADFNVFNIPLYACSVEARLEGRDERDGAVPNYPIEWLLEIAQIYSSGPVSL